MAKDSRGGLPMHKAAAFSSSAEVVWVLLEAGGVEQLAAKTIHFVELELLVMMIHCHHFRVLYMRATERAVSSMSLSSLLVCPHEDLTHVSILSAIHNFIKWDD